MRQWPDTTAGRSIRWLPCNNVSAETAPPFALMQVQGMDERGFFLVSKPDVDGAWDITVVNGPTPIVSGGYGECSRDWPLRFLIQEHRFGWMGADPTSGYTVRAGEWAATWNADVPGYPVPVEYTYIRGTYCQTVPRPVPFFVEILTVYSGYPRPRWPI